MKRADFSMLLVLLGSLGVSSLSLFATRSEGRSTHGGAAKDTPGTLTDAAGSTVQLRRFSRIASNNLLADRLLLSLAEPERIVGLSRDGFETSTVRHSYGARAQIDPQGDLEALLALRPDLVLVNNYADHKRIERLREAGAVVFELGEMRGVATLLVQIERVAVLLGAPERGRALAQTFAAQMRSVAADIAPSERKTALYVSAHGTQLYGGARNTSYHDVLAYAGLIDVAAVQYEDWPAYTSEQILALDPEIVVTTRGQRGSLCGHQALSRLRACGPRGQVVEIASNLLVDPGLTMLEVALQVREAVYGAVANTPR